MVQMMKMWKQTRLGSGFSSLFPDFLQAIRVKKEEKRKKKKEQTNSIYHTNVQNSR